MGKSTEAIFWLKEFSKSWVNVVSDEIVYLGQVVESESGRVFGVDSAYIEAYLCHNLWLEIFFIIEVRGEFEYYVALIESWDSINKEISSRTRQARRNRNSSYTRQDNTVFINDIDIIKYPERVTSFLPVRSVVRLHRLNIIPDIISKAFESSDEIRIPFDEDWEASDFIPCNGKRPSNVIKSRTQSVSNFTYQESPRNGVFTFDEVRLNDIASILRVFIDGVSVRLTCDEGFNFSVEDIKVFLRPVDTSEGVSHWLHMLSSCE